MALAWLLAQGDDIVPIPGTNHVANVEQNAAAAELEIEKEDLERLNEVFAHGAGAGERYQPHVLKGVGL
jgi:aryl-alcohol dehydrogenase-like predicted oxidoreductase